MNADYTLHVEGYS